MKGLHFCTPEGFRRYMPMMLTRYSGTSALPWRIKRNGLHTRFDNGYKEPCVGEQVEIYAAALAERDQICIEIPVSPHTVLTITQRPEIELRAFDKNRCHAGLDEVIVNLTSYAKLHQNPHINRRLVRGILDCTIQMCDDAKSNTERYEKPRVRSDFIVRF